MKRIIYTPHLNLRLKLRKFPQNYPLIIYKNSDMLFWDNIEKNHIAIKRLKYGKGFKNIMIAYEEKHNAVYIVTIHPISDEKITNRMLNGRWVKT